MRVVLVLLINVDAGNVRADGVCVLGLRLTVLNVLRNFALLPVGGRASEPTWNCEISTIRIEEATGLRN